MEKKSYIIGYDIGGTNARSALLEILPEQTPTPVDGTINSSRENQTPQGLAAYIVEDILSYANKHKFKPQQLKNIGLAIAAQIHKDRHTIINAPNLKWKNVNFAKLLTQELNKKKLDTHILIENDLNAILWGEAQLGAAKYYDEILAMYLGTGLGTAMIINNKLHRGANNLAGELGHAKTPLSNKMCGCGQMSCVESVASGIAIEKKLAEELKNSIITPQEINLENGKSPNPANLEYAYKKNNPYAVKYWNDTAEILADTLSAAITILDPQALLLGGGVFNAAPSLKTLFIRSLLEKLPETMSINLKILQPGLKENAGTIGAAMLAFMENQGYNN